MLIDEEKKALRKQMFAKRNAIDLQVKAKYDAWVCSQLEKIIIESGCKTIHSYIPFLSEIDISPLIQRLLDAKIKVVCPKTLPKRKLENRVLVSLDELEVGIMGTKHPAAVTLYDGSYDFIIVPGMAFDKAKFRLGYGGGYYDNFLVTQPTAYKVGIFYPFQKVDAVPIEPHDYCLDTILVKEFDTEQQKPEYLSL